MRISDVLKYYLIGDVGANTLGEKCIYITNSSLSDIYNWINQIMRTSLLQIKTSIFCQNNIVLTCLLKISPNQVFIVIYIIIILVRYNRDLLITPTKAIELFFIKKNTHITLQNLQLFHLTA